MIRVVSSCGLTIKNQPSQAFYLVFPVCLAYLCGSFITTEVRRSAVSGLRARTAPFLNFIRQTKATSWQNNLVSGHSSKAGIGWQNHLHPFPVLRVTRDMFIGMNELEIRETDLEKKIETSVLYFNLINEPYAGLVRSTIIRNLGPTAIDLEILDGLPEILPNGVNNDHLKKYQQHHSSLDGNTPPWTPVYPFSDCGPR